MNNLFNTKLQNWLNDENHTIQDGCLLLLQMENNQIHYQNLLRHPNKVAVMKYLQTELQKRLKIRLANVTHQEVAEMEEKVEVIVKKHFAYQEAAKSGTTNEEFRKGKRADHDQLPEEIQARYIENLDLLRKMRELHLKLRTLSTQQVSCPDSERYPFLKELIALDKQLHENWEVYDHYVLEVNGTGNHMSSTDKNGAADADADAGKTESAPESSAEKTDASEDGASDDSPEDSPEHTPADSEATKEPAGPADPATSAKATKTTKTTKRTRTTKAAKTK